MKITLATVAKNEAAYIAEWVAFHLLQGITSVMIFDNSSDDGTVEIAMRFKSYVTVIPWPTPERAYFIPYQQAGYAEALRVAQAERVDWMMFCDPDEFTFAEHGLTLPDYLAGISKEIGAIAVKPYDFGSCGRLHKPSKGLVIENFWKSVTDSFAQSRGYVKTIARPEATRGMQDTPHSVSLCSGWRYTYPDGTEVEHSPERHGLVENPRLGGIIQHHYITKSWAEFLAKRARYAGKTREIDDSFFYNREDVCNAVDRLTLVGMTDRVTAKMAEFGL